MIKQAKTKGMTHNIVIYDNTFVCLRRAREQDIARTGKPWIIYYEICYSNSDIGLRYWSVDEGQDEANIKYQALQYCEGYKQALQDVERAGSFEKIISDKVIRWNTL